MARKRSRKVRVEFRKNRERRRRENDLTKTVGEQGVEDSDFRQGERISGKGEIARHRTVLTDDETGDGLRAIDLEATEPGRVIRAVGLNSMVEADDGSLWECTVRRVIRTMSRDERNAVVAGDRVRFSRLNDEQGVIERVELRHGVLSRTSARREHVIVANIDQIVIVVSADDPPLKPNLIDRFLISAEKGGTRAVVAVNKMDLVGDGDLQPIFTAYGSLGYDVVALSAETGRGVDRLRSLMRNRTSVLTGQSGVGKSSLLNAICPGWNLQTGAVSDWSSKGRHTTRRAELLRTPFGGWVADTPGIRQMELWDVSAGEVEGYFVEFRPFVIFCRFPDCTHTHEGNCGVQTAVEHGLIDRRRYESYRKLITEE